MRDGWAVHQQVLLPVPRSIPPGAPVIHEAGHFTPLLSLHESDGVREPPLAAADDQLVPIQLDFIDQQPQVGLAQA
jgi:hypothetical protein